MGTRPDIATFSRKAGRSLRPYQLDCARAIVRSVLRGEGKIFTVMFARQMGKNETSAQIEAFLLDRYRDRGGTIVKAAPSFKPQLIISLKRLTDVLAVHPDTMGAWKPAYGHILSIDQAAITFYSAAPRANVVGATASLLLEIDEAQDVEAEKYDRDFRPMASSTNATTVLYGTAWSEDSILERQKRLNLEHEHRTGEKLHFEYDWQVLAQTNPKYRTYVESEIARLGADHPSIRTQYFLQCLADAGKLFSAEQRLALQGTHDREMTPRPGAVYVAGVDVAGEDEQATDAAARVHKPSRDSTVVTIAEVDRDRHGRPIARIVDHAWWTGRDHKDQRESMERLVNHWHLSGIWIDAGGIGHGLASELSGRFPTLVEKFTFTAASKSELGFDMLAMINSGRVQIYAADGSPEYKECWDEISACRYWLRGNEQMNWGVPPSEGHDDFVASLALCCRAADRSAPRPAAALIRPQPIRDYDGW